MNYQGLITCTKYAFPPNSLGYCGPDAVNEIVSYMKQKKVDLGLKMMLEKFQTLYPYLKLIAFDNNISDPFNPLVVEAYWIGNSLLKNVSMKNFYNHLINVQNLKKKIKRKDLEYLVGKIPLGALPHHSFHVFNIFLRTGNFSTFHTLNTMDSCRIGWGKVVELKPLKVQVLTKPLVLIKGKLYLGNPVIKDILLEYKSNVISAYPKIESYISFHWNYYCDMLNVRQVENLEKYTKYSIYLANQTI